MIIFKDGPQESQQDQTTVSLFTERLNKSTTGLVVEDMATERAFHLFGIFFMLFGTFFILFGTLLRLFGTFFRAIGTFFRAIGTSFQMKLAWKSAIFDKTLI